MRQSYISNVTSTSFVLCSNIAEQLIEKGLASVVRHKRDDEDRSPDYDKLMAAEQVYVICYLCFTMPIRMDKSSAVEGKLGIHSGKENPPPKQPLNISEVGVYCL